MESPKSLDQGWIERMERKKDSYRLQVESAGDVEGGREGERERETGREAWHGCGMDGGGVGIWNHQEEGRCERLGAEGGGEGEKGFRWCGR